mmetsp:Transcript_2205/g.2311  ORF Transcript_2205/g.2311 Transcript_2205/m.2311 type:complete len:514 (+) Transcript_2205:15-1556(+)
MRTLALFLTTLLVCISAQDQAGDYAGMKLAASRSFIKRFTDKVVPNFVNHFKPIYVPQVFNRFYVEISQITIAKMQLPSDSFDGYFDGNDLVLFTDNATVSIAMVVKIALPFYEKPMMMNVTCSNSGVDARFGFSYLNGYPLFQINELNVDLRNIDMTFNGTIMPYVGSTISTLLNSWILHPVQKFLADFLKDKIVAASNEKFYHMFDNTTLYNQSVSVSLDLVDSAEIGDDYISVPLEGLVYETHHGKKYFPVPQNVELPQFNYNSTGELQLFISEYTVNTGLYLAWVNGKFNLKISTDQPKSDGFAMKLKWIRDYVTSITSMFGGSSTNIVVEMDCIKPPTIAFTKDKIQFNAHFNYTVYAKYHDAKFKVYQSEAPYSVETPLHETNMTLNLLNPQIRQESFNFTWLNSITQVAGAYDIVKLQDIANNMIVMMFQKMNFITTIGALPSLIDVNKTTVSCQVHDGFIQLNANPEFIQHEDVELFSWIFEDNDYEPEDIQYFVWGEDKFVPTA